MTRKVGFNTAKGLHKKSIIEGSCLILALLILVTCSLAAVQGGSQTDAFEQVSIGAFDADSWSGIVFESTAYGQRLPFAIRVGSKSGTFLDGDRIFNAVSEVGPHAPDGSYARMSWNHFPRTANVTLEWARVDATTVVGRIKAPADIQLVLEAYPFPETSFTGAYRLSANGTQIIGDHPIDNHFASAAHFLVATDRPILGSGTFASAFELQKVMDSGQLANGDRSAHSGAVGLQFVTGVNSYAHFVATIGWHSDELSATAKRLLEGGKIDAILQRNSARYEQKRQNVSEAMADETRVP